MRIFWIQWSDENMKDKYLSFVTEETIAVCFMYGDMLTSLRFDINDEKFKQIAERAYFVMKDAY